MTSEIEKYFDCSLPKTYKEFVAANEGGTFEDVYLYKPSMLLERNECYETMKYAPGYIAIGDDGGGMAFILKLDESDPEVSTVGHGCMDPEFKETIFNTFSGWQASGFEYGL